MSKKKIKTINNIFVKTLLCVVIGVMTFVFFKFKTTENGDLRMEVAACHNDGIYSCGGTACAAGYTCTATSMYGCDCIHVPYCDHLKYCACGCTETSYGGYCKSCCLYSVCGDLGCSSNTTSGGVCNSVPEPTIPPIDYSCTGNQNCTSTCSTGTGGNNAYVICYDNNGRECPGYRDSNGKESYWIYLARCYQAPTGVVGKQCTTCYNVAGYCNGSPGWYDDCGGTGCGYCAGTNPAATPIPTATGGGGGGGTSCNCSDYLNTVATTCSNSTFYCPTSNPASYCYGTKACVAPTYNSLTILNTNLSALTADSNGRNNICESVIANDTNPRRVLFSTSVSDTDGYSDIASVEMRRNGVVLSMDFVSGSANTATYIKSVDYTGINETQVYPIEIRVTDSNGLSTGWVDTGRSFKVWDCQVAVSGSVYDSSNGALACNSSFTDLADAFLNFNALLFSNSGSGDDVLVGVNSENDYGVNYLTWNDTYSPYFNGGNSLKPNGDLSGTGRITRVIDSVTSTTNCPLVNQYSIRLGDYVSAYSLAPAAKIDFSFIRNQEGWFQVTGAGIKAKLSVDSGVPATINSALTISGINATNGLVSFTSSSNINGNNSALYGSPNNWWIDKNTNDSVTYSYQSFYNDIYIKNGIGMTVSSQTFVPSTGIYFINDDLYIEDNVVIDTDKYFMAAVKGKIIISENVSRIDGIYVADGGIDALGLSNDQLVINGMLYSRGDIRLARSFIDKSLNNSGPATVVNYRPSLIFNMPGKLMRVLSGWKEE